MKRRITASYNQRRTHRTWCLLLLALSVASCGPGKSAEEKRAGDPAGIKAGDSLKGSAEIVFDTLVNDLGTLKEGEQVVAYYDYTNQGTAPLIITRINAGCGCTVPSWNNAPLQPGASENIRVVFNSRGKKGIQNIRISVLTNAVNSQVDLRLKAIVESNQ